MWELPDEGYLPEHPRLTLSYYCSWCILLSFHLVFSVITGTRMAGRWVGGGPSLRSSLGPRSDGQVDRLFFLSHSCVFQLLIVALFVTLFSNNFFFSKTVTCRTFTFLSLVHFCWFPFSFSLLPPVLPPVVLPTTRSPFHTMSL